MYKLESINNSNLNKISQFDLNEEYLNELMDICSNKNAIKKILLSKNIKYIKDNDSYIGFVWYNKIRYRTYKIYCIKISEEYHDINYYKDLFLFFNNSSSIFINDNNNLSKEIMLNLNFHIEKSIEEMKINIKETRYYEPKDNVKFRVFIDGRDEANRCRIQNEVFHSVTRQAIEEEDVIYEKIQSYYIPEGCIFISLDDEDIGYGQLVMKEKKMYLVNFGIIPKYRGKGYGKMLIRKILSVGVSMGYEEIYLRCDADNYQAINLYEKEGFRSLTMHYRYKKEAL